MALRILDQMNIPIAVRTSEEYVELRVGNRIHELVPKDATELAKELMRGAIEVTKTATPARSNGDTIPPSAANEGAEEAEKEETEEEEEEEEDEEEEDNGEEEDDEPA